MGLISTSSLVAAATAAANEGIFSALATLAGFAVAGKMVLSKVDKLENKIDDLVVKVARLEERTDT